MTKIKYLIATSFSLMLASHSSVLVAQQIPADTYFSLAVSENSHNHYGENLLFLDFAADNHCNSTPRTVCARSVAAGTINLDGKTDDWKNQPVTRIRGRLMNNYPLGLHYDATPTELQMSAAFDNDYVYFMIHWEDANHDASINRNRWVYKQGKWQSQPHTKPAAGTPAAKTTNINEDLAGVEDEDQLFMMFPITDQQNNFTSGGLGCAGYCHPNLSLSGDPKDAKIGDGSAAMHTAFPDDTADLWHWTATRTAPMNTLKDGYLVYGDQSYNGRKVDDGTHPFDNNGQGKPIQPEYVHRQDYESGKYNTPGYSTPLLTPENSMKITPDMHFAENVSIPFYVHKPATGGMADVATAAYFNDSDHSWTVEIKRKLLTDDSHDHQFVPGTDAVAPTEPQVAQGDPARGEKLFVEKACADCHGESGEGTFLKKFWTYPRNQRTSAPAIRKTVSIHRPERLIALGAVLEKYDEEPPRALMPYILLTPQEAEDIASWLQQQYIHRMQ